MDKQKKQLIITIVLVAVMLGNFARIMFFKDAGTKKTPSARSAAAGSLSVNREALIANVTFLSNVRQNEAARARQEAEWEKEWGRDPFSLSLSAGKAAGIEGSFILSGIVWDEKLPLAIINQKLLKASDSIDGCLVKEIRRSSVTLTCSEKSFELQLFRPAESAEPAGEKQALP